MGSRTKSLLAELRRGLEQLYGPRLKGVYLYGSYARDEADPESDLDILVVLEDYRNYGEEIQRTSELGSNISLKYDVTVSKIFLKEHDWLTDDSAFLENVRKEAVPA